jgi:hypothetical protein
VSPYTDYLAVKGQWVEIPGDPDEIIYFNGESVPGKTPGAGAPTNPTTPTTPTTPPPTYTLTTLPNTIMRLDARDISGGAGTPVSTLADPVSGLSFTVPSGGTAPVVATDPNGRKFIRFNGQQDRLSISGTLINPSKGFTIYAVVRMARATRGTVFSQGSTTAVNRGVLISCSGANYIRGLRMSDSSLIARATYGIVPDSWQVVTITSPNANSVAMRVQEKAGTPIAPASTVTDGFTTDTISLGAAMSRISSQIGKFTDSGQFDLAALIICDAVHDTNAIQSAEKALSEATLVGLPSRGGALNDVDAILARRAEKTIAEGLFSIHPITGETMGVYENTGVPPGEILTAYDGTFKTSADNQVIRNLRISGDVLINHGNVTFENCVISTSKDPKTGNGTKPFGVTTYRFCEIGGVDEDSGTALGYNRYTAENCWIHDCEDGIRLGNQVAVSRCLVTHLSHALLDDGSRVHADAVQSNAVDNGTTTWATVENCNLPGRRDNGSKGNSAFILNNEQNFTRRIRARSNVVGSGSYTVFVTANPYYAEQFEIIDNWFIGDAADGDLWLPDKSQSGFLTLSGNRRADGTALKIYRTVLKSMDNRIYNGTTPAVPVAVTAGP